MIKTYNARVQNNNISYLLEGKQRNQMRYNFTNGNVITNKYPSITLRNRYAQELLESSLLFANNTVVLERTEEEYPGELDALKKENNETPTEKQPKTEEVKGIRTTDEVIAYVNERFDKDCKTLATAMKHASKAGLVFPDFNE